MHKDTGEGEMNKAAELLDRRSYEIRGVALKAQEMNKAPSEQRLKSLCQEFSQKYGEGWKLDSVYPGAIFGDPQRAGFEEGYMVVFKRRRQLRDE